MMRVTSHHRRGQVLVIILIGMALMSGLIFYVYNLGSQVNQQVDMQDAADATAISGAGWMARSMNLIAMNNVGQAKTISLVPILDSMPLGTEMAYNEVSQWENALAIQLDRGVPTIEHDIIRNSCENLRQRMASQRDLLAPVNALLNGDSGFSMADITYWRSGGGGAVPQGKLWQACEAMDELSSVTAGSAGIFAQSNAALFGKQSGAQPAFIAPILPRIAAKRGQFSDFQYVIEGSMTVRDQQHEAGPLTVLRSTRSKRGGAIPDAQWPHRLGPWATLHKWRYYIREATNWQWVPGSGDNRGQTRGGGGVGISGRRSGGSARTQSGGGSNGGFRAIEYKIMGYSTYGPYHWALSQINDYARGFFNFRTNQWSGQLPDTLFRNYIYSLANTKLRYMFTSSEPRDIHIPNWQFTQYPEAKAAALADESKVYQTMFYLVEIASANPKSSPLWLNAGAYRANEDYALSIWARGWKDPAKMNMTKVGNHVWLDEYTYEVTKDAELGLVEQFDANGDPIWHTVYMTAYYIFGGIDTGESVEVGNPCNWLDGDELPAPTLLDTDEGDYNYLDTSPESDYRRENFMYLGVVLKDPHSGIWQKQFKNPNPAGKLLALAQAEVFNNKSWDLWTQDWQAKLHPMTRWDDWLDTIEDGQVDLNDVAGIVDGDDVDEATTFMRRLGGDLAERYKSN